MKLSPGSTIAERYRLIRPLGEGGMGEVWAATHLLTKRPVALKRLLHTLDSRPGGQARARFVREAQTACAVEHPNVVEILDFIEGGADPPVIVMELLHGETLASRLSREHTLPLDETARVLLPVVSAVGTAHSLGIVHRDLKPANVFLSRSGEGEAVVKVLDFGIAKWLVPQVGELGLRTQTGSTLGTPCYMAPEQAIGDRMVDHRIDMWSLGVIFYECLSGARPVEGENAAHMVMRLLSTGIIPIGQLVPTLPIALAELIGRMLSREPSRRPSDLREVFAALAPLANVSVPAFGEPRVQPLSQAVETGKFARVSAPPLTWGVKTPTVAPDGLSDVVVHSRAGRRPARRLGLWAALMAAAAGAALAAPWFRATPPARAVTWGAPVAADESVHAFAGPRALGAQLPPAQSTSVDPSNSIALRAPDSSRAPGAPSAKARAPAIATAIVTAKAREAKAEAAASSSEVVKIAPNPLDIELQ